MIRYRFERNVPTTHDLCDLSENAENKGFFLVENEQHLSEVRMRKLTERINQNDLKLNSLFIIYLFIYLFIIFPQ